MTTLVSGVDRLCPYGVPPPLRSYVGIGILSRHAGFGLQYGHGSHAVVFLKILSIVAD